MSRLRALIVDYGGVLTSPLAETISAWLRAEQLDTGRFSTLMREWLGPGAARNIVHDLETGRLAPEQFERELAAQLARADGSLPEAEGLLRRMFAGFHAHDGMATIVRKIRLAGHSTALLSNSWGFGYAMEGWVDLFDAVVISGEVGMRKPDPEIYLYTAAQLGVRPEECVFVDDLRPNVRGALAVGMVGVHHTHPDETVRELEVLFDMVLR